uniref:Zinc transporter ZIP12 n=1 Tax=Nippostrongylus brasiliensis TaxID=27835 RepID=A0A0N4XFX9_NIPBR
LEVTHERKLLLRLSAVIVTIYLIYFFEFVLYYRKHHKNKKGRRNGYSKDLERLCCSPTIYFQSRALVILLGDGVHNFIDGIAIGTSFMSSTKLGIITSIAVICHELPHELGDFAVLIESGLSTATALGFNLLSALTAFLGLFVSISLGEFKEVQTWLLAITAGMFLYVAWIDMLSHLKHDGSHVDHWTFACFLQYSGFCVGFVLILALGWFEDELFSS